MGRRTSKYLQKLRYEVIVKRAVPFDDEDIEHARQNKLLNAELVRQSVYLNLARKPIMMPVFIIKMRRFIRENCPDYISRLK